MVTFTLDGAHFDPDDLRDVIMQAAVDQIKQHLHESIASIRDPTTGEFPVVRISGSTLENISARIEGSPELLALVRERLDPDDLGRTTLVAVKHSGPPKVFLSFGWNDHALAKRIAEALLANGIETWWAEWEIRAGDSMRQKIDEGLSNCTVFLVLLTPDSIKKPWVNQEMDAGLLRKIEAHARSIALRSDLPTSALPPLLKGMLSPSIDDFEADVSQLIHDIHGVSRKPPLGPVPEVVKAPDSGYSPAATAVAKVFVDASEHALPADPMLTISELCDETSLSEEDVTDALYELGDLVDGDHGTVIAKPELFAEFDKYFQGWDPGADALALAADLVNDASFPSEPPQIAERYGWKPRRLNAAVAYLASRNLIENQQFLNLGPWGCAHIEKTDATRRFVKSRL